MEEERKLTKKDEKVFTSAIKKAANKEILCQEEEKKVDLNGTVYTYYHTKKTTVVEKLADDIVKLALDPDTPLKDKLAIFEKFAKISEGETRTQNTNVNVGVTGSYEEFLLKAEELRKLPNGN